MTNIDNFKAVYMRTSEWYYEHKINIFTTRKLLWINKGRKEKGTKSGY